MRQRRITYACLVAASLLTAGACTQGASGPEETAPGGTPEASVTSTPIEIVTEPLGDWFQSSCRLPLELLRRERRGIFPGHSPELSVVPREPNYFGGFTAFTHSGPWDYTQEVPLLLYGPGHIKSQGELDPGRETTLADIAPTTAALIDTPWPADRPGRPITEALLGPSDREPPKLVLTIVWDGGGWNVLNTWPDAWPTLAKLMHEGTSVQGTIGGSAPSVTPPMHANIGTGAFPKQHGIVDINIRDGDGTSGAFDGRTPRFLQMPTLADMYDQSVGNAAKIGLFGYKSWHLGMMGHGAYIAGGDKDIDILADRGARLTTNKRWYRIPGYLRQVGGFDGYVREVDIDDGKADGRWMGHDILRDVTLVRHSPVWALYQTDLLKAVLEREGFGQDGVTDLFYINYKQIDDVGHDYNMLEPEVREIVRYTDTELAKIVKWLNQEVGRNQWVIALTADHGQGPEPLRSGSWPIRFSPLMQDIEETFDVDSEALFDNERPGAFWVNEDAMREAGITLEDLANFFVDYRLKDNTPPDEAIPDVYARRLEEPIFAAAFPTSEVDRVWRCATGAQG